MFALISVAVLGVVGGASPASEAFINPSMYIDAKVATGLFHAYAITFESSASSLLRAKVRQKAQGVHPVARQSNFAHYEPPRTAL